MSLLIQHSTCTVVLKSELKSIYRIGGVAAFLQLAAILSYAVVIAMLGPKPVSSEEYYSVFQSSPLNAFFRGDFLLMVLIGLYLGTFPAIYVALRDMSPIYTALASVFTLIAVTGCFATESSFSLFHLGNLYTAAVSDAQRAQLVAAGEAIMASDMWNGSAAYMGGILLQGAGVMISVIMSRSGDFNKVTAYTGLLGNGLDMIQHIIHPFAPSISASISMVMGLFYFVWFPMLGWDLLRLSRKVSAGA